MLFSYTLHCRLRVENHPRLRQLPGLCVNMLRPETPAMDLFQVQTQFIQQRWVLLPSADSGVI